LGNGQAFAIDDPSASCVGAGTRVVFNDLASVKDVLDRAFTAAGATPKLEASETTKSANLPDEDDGSPDAERTTDDDEGEEVVEDGPKSDDLGSIPSSGCSSSGRAPSGAPFSAIFAVFALVLRRIWSGRTSDPRATPGPWKTSRGFTIAT